MRSAGSGGRRWAGTAMLVLAALAGWPGSAGAEDGNVTVVFDRALPNVPGKSLRAVTVVYGPGGASPPHTHAPSAFIDAMVLDGAVRSRVDDGPERIFRAGESFSEMPGDRHGVSANASATEPARLLAVFVVDTAETVLTTPARPTP